MGNPEGIARRCRLPNDEFTPAWTSIKLADGVRERLLAQSLLSFTIRQKLPFEAAPLHGLILLKARRAPERQHSAGVSQTKSRNSFRTRKQRLSK